MCRNIAEGFKELFKLMLEITHKNFDEEKIIKLNGVYVPSILETSILPTTSALMSAWEQDAKMSA